MNFRKVFKTLFFTVILFSLSMSAFAAEQKNIKILLDGKELSFSEKPYIENSRTMVQMRPIFEALGFSLSWDDSTKTVYASKGGVDVRLTANSYEAYKNNQKITVDAAPEIKNDFVFVPLRFIAESTGDVVNWDGDTETISITTDVKNVYVPSGDITISDSVVMINTDKKQGSGVILSSDGYIATNYHVIENASSLNVVFNNKAAYTGDVSLVSYDTARDVAIIKINYSGLYPAEIYDKLPSNGESVMSVGSSDGKLNSFSQGMVKDTNDYIISTDAPFEKGGSGGALFNSKGKVIGITSYYDSSLNYLSIPIGFVSKLEKNQNIPLSKWKDISLLNEAPKGFSVSADLQNVYLSWAQVYGASGYKVYYSDDKYGQYTVLEGQNDGLFSWGFPYCARLMTNGSYYFCVSAVINGEESQKSEIVAS